MNDAWTISGDTYAVKILLDNEYTYDDKLDDDDDRLIELISKVQRDTRTVPGLDFGLIQPLLDMIREAINDKSKRQKVIEFLDKKMLEYPTLKRVEINGNSIWTRPEQIEKLEKEKSGMAVILIDVMG